MKWEDVGGLEDVKKSILDTVQVGCFISAASLFDNIHKDCFFFFFLIRIQKRVRFSITNCTPGNPKMK